MTGAAQYLATLDRVTGKRIGAVGLRLAGGLAIWAAAASPLIGAAVTYYVMPHGKPDFAKIDGAVLGHFGTTDELVSADHIAMLEAELRGAGVDFAFELYEGAGHSFFNDTDRLGTYDPVAATRSWDRTLAFLRERLAA